MSVKNPLLGSKAALSSWLRNSLNRPPPSMPASSRPEGSHGVLTYVLKIYSFPTCGVHQLNSHFQPQVCLVVWAQFVKGVFIDVIPVQHCLDLKVFAQLYWKEFLSSDLRTCRSMEGPWRKLTRSPCCSCFSRCIRLWKFSHYRFQVEISELWITWKTETRCSKEIVKGSSRNTVARRTWE